MMRESNKYGIEGDRGCLSDKPAWLQGPAGHERTPERRAIEAPGKRVGTGLNAPVGS